MRIIAHLDMDAFFAAVEERDNPRIKGLPIVVGADPMEGKGRGVVSTANYKARKYGIRSALPISKAWQYSEKAKREGKSGAVFLPVNMERYAEVSEQIMKIIQKYSAVTEQSSIDEMYIDLTNAKNFSKSEKICHEIKKEIREKEKLTASIGIGPNKLIAKIASDARKPDGLTVIKPEEVENFLEPLSIRKIPGIGPKTEQYFNKMGVYKVKDLKKFSREELREMLGKWGLALYDKAKGVDDSPISEEYERKSIGEQETFPRDTLEFSKVVEKMNGLCADIFRRLKKSEFGSFRTITITMRFSDFETKNRSHTLIKSASTLKILKTEALKLLMPFFDRRENPKRKLVRLIGVRLEKLK